MAKAEGNAGKSSRVGRPWVVNELPAKGEMGVRVKG